MHLPFLLPENSEIVFLCVYWVGNFAETWQPTSFPQAVLSSFAHFLLQSWCAHLNLSGNKQINKQANKTPQIVYLSPIGISVGLGCIIYSIQWNILEFKGITVKINIKIKIKNHIPKSAIFFFTLFERNAVIWRVYFSSAHPSNPTH